MKEVKTSAALIRELGGVKKEVAVKKPAAPKSRGDDYAVKAAELAARAAISSAQAAASVLGVTESIRDTLAELRSMEREEESKPRKIRLIVRRGAGGLIDAVDVVDQNS